MAEKRMFAKTIIDSDAFLDMPQTTQLLYFHLGMRADDDGFINNPKSIIRNTKCGDDDLRILCSKKFVIPFESGVVVIKHWKTNNYIAKDRYTETKYKSEKALLELDENKSYKEHEIVSYTECTQDVDTLYTQVRLDKISIDKIKDIVQQDCTVKVSIKKIDSVFESLWKLYPNKKGKGQVSAAKKKKLFEIGFDKLSIAIQRYSDELKKDDWRKQQNGSTFFNSGYIDYLDENFELRKKTIAKSKSAFNNFSQNEYDFKSLEDEILAN